MDLKAAVEVLRNGGRMSGGVDLEVSLDQRNGELRWTKSNEPISNLSVLLGEFEEILLETTLRWEKPHSRGDYNNDLQYLCEMTNHPDKTFSCYQGKTLNGMYVRGLKRVALLPNYIA